MSVVSDIVQTTDGGSWTGSLLRGKTDTRRISAKIQPGDCKTSLRPFLGTLIGDKDADDGPYVTLAYPEPL